MDHRDDRRPDPTASDEDAYERYAEAEAMRAHQGGPGPFLGLLLVTIGAGLLARELGMLPPELRLLDFWPALVVVIGLSVLLRARGVVSALFALSFIGVGGVLLAANLGFLASSVTRFWPVLVVLLGLWALFRGGREPDWRGSSPRPPFEPGKPPWERASWGEHAHAQATDQDQLNRQYTAAGAELRIESQAWKGGALGVTAGGVELDLRHARLAPEGAVLMLHVVMGGVEIRVPDTWKIQLDVRPFLGGADDSTRTTQGVSSAPRLLIVGNVTLGGVNVSN